MKPIRVVVADDHYLIVEAVCQQLAGAKDVAVVGKATTGKQLEALLRQQQPDVVLLDLHMPASEDNQGFFQPAGALACWHRRYPSTSFVVLSQYSDPAVVRALVKAGAKGYLLKGDELSLHLTRALRYVVRGLPFFSPTVAECLFTDTEVPALTEREAEVLQAVAATPDATAAMLGCHLGIAEQTVYNHLASIYEKLGVSSRAAAIREGVRLGLLPQSILSWPAEWYEEPPEVSP